MKVSSSYSYPFPTPAISRPPPNGGATPTSKLTKSASSSIASRLKRDAREKTFYYSVSIGRSLSSAEMVASVASDTQNHGTLLDRNDTQKYANLKATGSEWRDPTFRMAGLMRGIPSKQPRIPLNYKPSSMLAFYQQNKNSTTSTPSPKTNAEPIALHPDLQAYFWSMQRTAFQTVHPLIILGKATRIAVSLLSTVPGPSPFSSSDDSGSSISTQTASKNELQPVNPVDDLLSKAANEIILAAVEDASKVRTMALVAYETSTELGWKDIRAQSAFEAALVKCLMKSFDGYWGSGVDHSLISTPTGLDLPTDDANHAPPHPPSLRSETINSAALAGSLYALQMLPYDSFASCVTSITTHISELIFLSGEELSMHPNSATCVYLRGLYILLLNATTGRVVMNHKYADLLQQVKNALETTDQQLSEGDLASKVMERRWIIEICSVLESAIADIPPRPVYMGSPWYVSQPAYYRWDPLL